VKYEDQKEIVERTFLEKFLEKIGNFYHFFGSNSPQIIDVLAEKKIISPEFVKTLALGLPSGDVALFERLVSLVDLCPALSQETLQEIWEKLDQAIGEKYEEVGEECRRRCKILEIYGNIPKNVIGLSHKAVLSFGLYEKTTPKIYGYSCYLNEPIKCFALTKDAVYLGNSFGLYKADFEGNETVVYNYNFPRIVVMKITQDFMFLRDVDSNDIIFNMNPFSKEDGLHVKDSNLVIDEKGTFYWIQGVFLFVKEISCSSPVQYRIPSYFPVLPFKKAQLTLSKSGKYIIIRRNKYLTNFYLFETTTRKFKDSSLEKNVDGIFFSCRDEYLFLTEASKTTVYQTKSYPKVYKEFTGEVLGTADKRNFLVLWRDGKTIVQNFEGKIFCVIANCKGEISFSEDGSLLAITTSLTSIYKVSTGELLFSNPTILRGIKFY